MAKYSIESSTLTNIANAIREKTGEAAQIPVADFASQIAGISTGKKGIKVTVVILDYFETTGGSEGYINGVPYSASNNTVEIEVLNGSIWMVFNGRFRLWSNDIKTSRGCTPLCFGEESGFACMLFDPLYPEDMLHGLQEGDTIEIRLTDDD